VPKFSIIIPVKSINDYIRETVCYIQALKSYEWELFIIPNNVEKNEWSEDKRITVIGSGRLGPADKRDLGAQKASGDILVFLDDDSYPEPNLLEVASKYFNNPEISALGGPGITPVTNSFWQRVSGAVFLSRFIGGAPERYVSLGKSREVDDWPSVNLMVRRLIFMKVGGFDCKYWPGEDTKLCIKLKDAGKKIVYAPDMVVWHHRRSGLRKHLNQVGSYGFHRGYFSRNNLKTSFHIKSFIPSVFFLFILLNLGLFFLINYVPKLFIFVWMAYSFIILIGMIEALRFEKIFVVLLLLLYAPLTHFYYGFQFIRGYLKQENLVSRLR